MKRFLMLLSCVLLLSLPVFAIDQSDPDYFLTPEAQADSAGLVYDPVTDTAYAPAPAVSTAAAASTVNETPVVNTPPADTTETVGETVPIATTTTEDDKNTLTVNVALAAADVPAESSSSSVATTETLTDPTTTDPTWVNGGSGNSLTESLFGNYTPYDAAGIASVDFAWIADVVLFMILVSSFFKLIGAVIKRA